VQHEERGNIHGTCDRSVFASLLLLLLLLLLLMWLLLSMMLLLLLWLLLLVAVVVVIVVFFVVSVKRCFFAHGICTVWCFIMLHSR
jgi:hypothetical protein